uniref:RNA1 polyprotein n=1 Tax=Potato rugose stunting virus TaxID=3064989 RepID=A0AA49K626_9SECO|nr:polyprotein [Potato rugose stunting virus]
MPTSQTSLFPLIILFLCPRASKLFAKLLANALFLTASFIPLNSSKMAGVFSKIASAPSSFCAKVGNVKRAICSVTQMAEKFNDLADTVSPVVEAEAPKVGSICDALASICHRLNDIMGKLGVLLTPLFSAYEMVAKIWEIMVSSIVTWFKKATDQVSIFMEALCGSLYDMIEGTVLVTAVVCIVATITYCSHVLGDQFGALWSMIQVVIGTFFSTFTKVTWFGPWFGGFFPVAQGASHFMSDGYGKPLATSSGISSIFCFAAASVAGFFLVSQGLSPRGEQNPFAAALRGSGDFAAKCNNLFQLHKNIRMEIGECLGYVLDCVCDTVGLTNPTLSMINKMLNKDNLLVWMEDVNKACSPEGRLERFSDPAHAAHLADLLKKAHVFTAELATRPILSFVAHKYHSEVVRLRREFEQCVSHKGVGQKRDEPFMVYWYGAPGVGKTVLINAYIHDILDLMEVPKSNRIYSLPRTDAYWSGYAHQAALLIDDIGAVVDSAGHFKQVKQIMSVKSSHPVGLAMADLESKGTHFTSQYIFCTSNKADAPPDCGLMTPDAFRRRRDIVVHVRALGPVDAENPTSHIVFDVVDTYPPFREVEGLIGMNYEGLLSYTYNKCLQHKARNTHFRSLFSGSGVDLSAIRNREAGTGSEPCQDDRTDGEHPPQAQGPVEDHMRAIETSKLEACKYAWNGNFNTLEMMSTPALAMYNSMLTTSQEKLHRWYMDQLLKPLSGDDYNYWLNRIDPDWLVNVQMKMCMMQFKKERVQPLLSSQSGSLEDLFECEDPDIFLEFSHAPLPTKLALCFLAKHHQESMVAIMESKVPVHEQPWYKKMFQCMVEGVKKLPSWIKTILLLVCFTSAFSGVAYGLAKVLTWFVPQWSTTQAVKPALGIMHIAAATTKLTTSVARIAGGASNVSGDFATTKLRKGSKFAHLFANSCSPVKGWALDDPFLTKAFAKSAALIRFADGGFVRAVFIDTNWVMTVAHSMTTLPEGSEFTIIAATSKTPIIHSVLGNNCKQLPNQDVFFFNVRGACGLKPNLRDRLVKQSQFRPYPGMPAVTIIPDINVEGTVNSFLLAEPKATKLLTEKPQSLQYGSNKITVHCARTLEFQAEGQVGHCGSCIFVPNGLNNQPAIAGIHIASYTAEAFAAGMAKISYLAVVFREDIDRLLPPPLLLQAQGPSILQEVIPAESHPFPANQVFYHGKVPQELAATVPFATTLRKSPIFVALEEQFGAHRTEPSILTCRDERLGDLTFDPYIAGVEKFNETAHSFDISVAEISLGLMKQRIVSVLKTQEVPHGRPQVRDEEAVLNGIPGELFYDGMDMSTSSGWPFNLGKGAKNKLGHVTGEPGSFFLDRASPVFPAYQEMLNQVEEGIVPQIVTTECAKDERLPLSKIYQKPKTRLFTILPFHYNMLVRRYFLDFSATLMRSHNVLACKVGINPHGTEWTTLANQFTNVASVGFSADYSSFDGRAPVFIFQWFCDLVDEFYGDTAGSPNSLARHALLMAASHHCTLCGDDCFEVVGGMPSGFSLTVIFNSLLNEFYMRYAFAMLLKREDIRARAIGINEVDFDRIFIAVYGDDNLVAVPLDLSWYTLPRIAQELELVNVVIKNGLDKSADVNTTTTQPLCELTFLSRGFEQHALGYYLCPLKEISVLERLYWIRKSSSLSAEEALAANVETALQEAMYHGEVYFCAIAKMIQDCYSASKLYMPPLPLFQIVQRSWLESVVGGGPVHATVPRRNCEMLAPAVPLKSKDMVVNVHEIFPNIFVCSTRSAAHLVHEDYIMVLCGPTKSKSNYIRGPASHRDLQDKVWGFTAGAIQQEQILRCSQGKSGKLLFVSATGDGMAIICASLAALASGKYSASAVLNRYNQLLGFKGARDYCAGAGNYLCDVCGNSNLTGQGSLTGPYYTPGLWSEKVISFGPVRILANCSSTVLENMKKDFGDLWCTPTFGFGGVLTSDVFVKSDSRAVKLSAAILAARAFHTPLYLVFPKMEHRHVKWVSNACASYLEITDGVAYKELETLVKDTELLHLTSLPLQGWGIDKVSHNRFALCAVTEERFPIVMAQLPVWAPPQDWAKRINRKVFNKHSITAPLALQMLKYLLVLNEKVDFEEFKRLVLSFAEVHVAPKDTPAHVLLVAHVLIWCNNQATLAEFVDMVGLESAASLGWFKIVPKGQGVNPNIMATPGSFPHSGANVARSFLVEALDSEEDNVLRVSDDLPLDFFFLALEKTHNLTELGQNYLSLLVNENDTFLFHFRQLEAVNGNIS